MHCGISSKDEESKEEILQMSIGWLSGVGDDTAGFNFSYSMVWFYQASPALSSMPRQDIQDRFYVRISAAYGRTEI